MGGVSPDGWRFPGHPSGLETRNMASQRDGAVLEKRSHLRSDARHAHFGYLVDAPEIRALIEETARVTQAIRDDAARVEPLPNAAYRLTGFAGD
jgi:hypothetical protein